MKKLLLLFGLFIFTAGAMQAQSVCDILTPICSSQDGLNNNAADQSPLTITSTCQSLQGTRTKYYQLLIIQPTEFTFQIEPSGNIDYDFAVWVNADCNNLGVADRASYDAPATGEYNTGLSLTATDLCETSIGDGQVQSLSLVPGDEVIIVVDRYSSTPDTFDLTFGDPDAFDCSIISNCGITINEGDQILCDIPSFQLTTTLDGPVESYEWYKDGTLIPGETNDNLLVTETGNYQVKADGTECTYSVTDSVDITLLFGGGCTIEPICTGVDFEEDFGTGNGRVSTAYTSYTFNGSTQVDDGQYTITNTSADLNIGWFTDMEDHTEGDTNGRMLLVNASLDADEFYRRTINLNPDIDYTFNAWITTIYDTDTAICPGTGIPSNVIFRIEDPAGNLIAETNTGDIENESEPNWQQFAIAFNTGSNTDVQLVLINNSFGGCGNDLAIDDITLSLENQQPQILTPPDLSVCDNDADGEEVFNLEDQIPAILNGQDPALFNITFHNTEFEASANTNTIANPDSYTNTSNPETIYVRVEKVAEITCFDTVSFQLILNDAADLSGNLPSEVILCSGDEFPILDATPLDTTLDPTLITYEWKDSNGTIVSTDATYTPVADGSYTVTLTYPPCSEKTFTIDVIVNDPPILDLGEDQTVCDGSSYEITPTITGDTAGITYLWSTGETSPTITVGESGTYTLEVTVGACTVSDSIEIIISDPLVVELGDSFKTCPNETQTITATTSEANATYQWFLNGNIIPNETGSSIEIQVAPEAVGTQSYSVIISVGDCTGTDSVDVTLYDVGNCVISQGISPNGDGFNDSLDLQFLVDRAGGISKLQIFNRLGTMVFEQTNYTNQWRGQAKNGNDLPTGTYFYVIDLASNDPVYGTQATGWIYLNQKAN